jgi:inorganic pyrophosphatase
MDVIDVIIEIPFNTSTKYEVDKEHHMLRFDRMLQTAMHYPGNYGYIPKTLGGDGDPLDIIMPVDYPIIPMSIVKVRPVGVIIMRDEAGMDEKIIVYPDVKVDPRYSHINNISDVPKETLDRIRHFFEHYKDLSPGKFVQIDKDLKDKNTALKIINDSFNHFNKMIPNASNKTSNSKTSTSKTLKKSSKKK